MDRLSTQPRPTRARKSMWTRDDGSIIDRLIPSGRWAPREEVPRLWAESRDRLGDGCHCFKPKLEADGVPPLFAEAERRRTKRAKQKAAYGCEAEPAPRARPARPSRTISGERLAAMVRLDPELEAEVAGQQVELDEEAWGAAQAAHQLRGRVEARRKKVERRRARIWPSAADKARDNGDSSTDPCACEERSIVASTRYVDSRDGDDRNPGTLVTDSAGRIHLRPWKSLRRVEEWLNDDIYAGAERGTTCIMEAKVLFRKGRTWDGTEEPDPYFTTLTPLDWASPADNERHEKAILSIYNFKATRISYLTLGAYPPDTGTPLGDARLPPVIDGVVATSAFNNEPQVDDPRIGLAIYNSCYVAVDGLQIRGFQIGIDVRGGCKHHQYTNLQIVDHAQVGIRVSVTEGDAAYALGDTDDSDPLDVMAGVTAVIAKGLYPDEIIISDSTFRSIGYDTAGSDIGLGFLATNCTIMGNTLLGDDDPTGPRGVDGIVADTASSGHVIEGNRIGTHRIWCDGTTMYKSYESDCSGTTACFGTSPSAHVSTLQPGTLCTTGHTVYTPTDYGYVIRDETPTGCKAFGEDGIDLKAVRQRTPTAQVETLVCGNTIWGHTNFTGITVNDGSQKVYVCRNRIFLNLTGISIENGDNSAWHHEYEPDYRDEKTAEIYVYRNQIYMNLGQGVHVEATEMNIEGTPYVFAVSDVYVVGNTIAHNLSTGVRVVYATDPLSVQGVHFANNLIARNGLAGDYPGEKLESMQFYWESKDLLTASGGCTSRNNIYLGWNRATVLLSSGLEIPSSRPESVIKIASQEGTLLDMQSLVGLGALPFEWRSRQAKALDDLALQEQATFEGAESYIDSVDPALTELDGFLDASSADTIEGIDYEIMAGSVCQDGGTNFSGADQPNSIYDIAVSRDYLDEPVVGIPDVGAYEAPVEEALGKARSARGGEK